ncbi:hypothetical protein MMPV_006534 [Pyropia vietnamensis]
MVVFISTASGVLGLGIRGRLHSVGTSAFPQSIRYAAGSPLFWPSRPLLPRLQQPMASSDAMSSSSSPSATIVPTPPAASVELPSAAHGRARELLTFWFGTSEPLSPYATTPQQANTLWFASGDAADAADAMIKDRFAADVEAALAADEAYMALAYGPDVSPWSALALVLLLDQLPRALYRGTARAFSGDPAGLAAAKHMLAPGANGRPALVDGLPWVTRMFAVMPLMHAENVDDVRRCVDTFSSMADTLKAHGEPAEKVRQVLSSSASFGRKHLDIVERFGRYPYRNKVLGRETTPDEEAWMAEGGDSFGQ